MCFLGLADAALGEGTGVKLHKLSVREIKAVRSFFLLLPLARLAYSRALSALRYGAPAAASPRRPPTK
jgi:hypothetical protein